MRITGLHLLLTSQCNFECDHCFVWGSPRTTETMSLAQVRDILHQAVELGTVKSIYFEGGEPFLYHPILVKSVSEAHRLGFTIGIVSNAYWATGVEEARAWLEPLAGLVDDLSVSSDLFHYDSKMSRQAANAMQAAGELGIPIGVISIARPDADAAKVSGQLPEGESGVMYRGRAADKLASFAVHHPWTEFTDCPHEDLREPGRVHVDPLGNVHVCQGIVAGNLFEKPLREISAEYDPDAHSIAGPLLAGGPVELVRRYSLPHRDDYADACHLCYESRRLLRSQFPALLRPPTMYGIEA
ncbi:MAG: radical SAM protein [Rudaea sp.]